MKPETHAAVTALALDAYARHGHSGLSGLLGPGAYRDAVCKGAVKEDAWRELSRLANWHFYPANEKLLRPVWGMLRPTSRHILMVREHDLLAVAAAGASATLFTLFGRVLHHIQDMSTPAHVVPVYHGPGLADEYENYLVEHWPAIQAALEVAPPGPGDAAMDSHPFGALYEAAAQRTLAELDAPATDFTIGLDDEPRLPAHTSLFWRRHDPSGGDADKYHAQGFGGFGPLGPYYGREAVTVAGHDYRVDRRVYVDLAARFVGHAVTDTLQACRRLERLIGAT